MNGEDGMKTEKRNISNNSMIRGKMMEFLLIGMKTELRLGSGFTKME